MASVSTPPRSAAPSPNRQTAMQPPLTIDLSNLPPVSVPRVSNTLLITNLLADEIYHPAYLATLKQLLESTAPLFSFSPLKSFRRIVVVYYDVDAAIAVRDAINGEKILGCVAKVFFGEHTPVDAAAQLLQAPHSNKLFFISPPPSPPHGWTSREEEPPNKDVMPEDLATALAQLSAKQWHITTEPMEIENVSQAKQPSQERTPEQSPITRNRSGSTTIVFDPEIHSIGPGSPKNLPAISVEDLTVEADEDGDMQMTEQPRPILAHTSRPPVELM